MINLHFIIILLVDAVVLLTFYLEPGLLRAVTKENGPFEWGTCLVLFINSLYLFLFWIRQKHKLAKTLQLLILSIAVLTFLGSLEEISWFQHVFHFESNSFFLSYNNQRETNFHNLFSSHIFNTLIYSVLYAVFIYLPMFYYLFDIQSLKTRFMPTLSTVMMFHFSFTLQAYFTGNILSYVDMTFLLLAMLLLGILFIKKRYLFLLPDTIHLFALLFSMMLFITHFKVFHSTNMQFEIREFVIAYTFFYWNFNWSKQLI